MQVVLLKPREEGGTSGAPLHSDLLNIIQAPLGVMSGEEWR